MASEKIRVGGIGQKAPEPREDPNEKAKEVSKQIIYRDMQSRMMINDMNKTDLDKSIITILNDIRAYRIEVASLTHALKHRGIITESELDASRMAVNEHVEAAMQEMTDRIYRAKVQRGNQ